MEETCFQIPGGDNDDSTDNLGNTGDNSFLQSLGGEGGAEDNHRSQFMETTMAASKQVTYEEVQKHVIYVGLKNFFLSRVYASFQSATTSSQLNRTAYTSNAMEETCLQLSGGNCDIDDSDDNLSIMGNNSFLKSLGDGGGSRTEDNNRSQFMETTMAASRQTKEPCVQPAWIASPSTAAPEDIDNSQSMEASMMQREDDDGVRAEVNNKNPPTVVVEPVVEARPQVRLLSR